MGLVTELLGMIFLPVLIILAFGMMTGAKVEGIISAMFSAIAELVKGVFKLLIPVITTIIKELPKLIAAGIKLATPAIEKSVSTLKEKKEKIKIIVKEAKNERK